MSDPDLLHAVGVGPMRIDLLGKLGLKNRSDLLFHLPSRYEDRSRFVPRAPNVFTVTCPRKSLPVGTGDSLVI